MSNDPITRRGGRSAWPARGPPPVSSSAPRDSLLRARSKAGSALKIEPEGFLIRDCGLPGETRADDVVPAHPNGIPVSRNRWLLVYATRKLHAGWTTT